MSDYSEPASVPGVQHAYSHLIHSMAFKGNILFIPFYRRVSCRPECQVTCPMSPSSFWVNPQEPGLLTGIPSFPACSGVSRKRFKR